MCFSTLAIIGSVVSAVGQVANGMASAANAEYQSQVAANNAQIARQNATYSIQAGQAKAQQESMKQAQTGGLIKAAQAANGVDVNTGSNVDVQTSQREKGVLDTETTVHNSQLQAYGYRTQATNFEAQSQLDSQQASQAEFGGILGATGSLLSSAKSTGFSFSSPATTTSPYSYGAGGYTGEGPFW
jgi:hypothetical protein